MSSNNVPIILLRPSLHCNTQLHFTTLHSTTLHYTYRHFTFTFHYPLIWLNPITFPTVLFHLTSLNQTQYSSHLQTYFQNNEPLHCPIESLTISLQFTSLHFSFFIIFFAYPINPSLHFILLFTSTTHFPSLHFPSLFTFYRLHFPSLAFTFLTLVLKMSVLPWEVISLSHFRFVCLESRLPQEFLSNTLNTGLCTLCCPSKGRNNDK